LVRGTTLDSLTVSSGLAALVQALELIAQNIFGLPITLALIDNIDTWYGWLAN